MLGERRMVPAPVGPGPRIFAADMDVTGSLAVVTGATEGIGRATAFALGRAGARVAICARTRSEEHTSELQSRLHLVCRLLLEKKKKTIAAPTPAIKTVSAQDISHSLQTPPPRRD